MCEDNLGVLLLAVFSPRFSVTSEEYTHQLLGSAVLHSLAPELNWALCTTFMRHLVDTETQPAALGRNKHLDVCFTDCDKVFYSTIKAHVKAFRGGRCAWGSSDCCAVKAMFDGNKIRFTCGEQRSESFSTAQGFKQGSLLSPFLFGIFVKILRKIRGTFARGG